MSWGTPREVSRRARELYERDIRPRVEAEHAGHFLVLDVESGAYVLGDGELEAFGCARAKTPEGVLYLLRVGHRVAHRIATVGYQATSHARYSLNTMRTWT